MGGMEGFTTRLAYRLVVRALFWEVVSLLMCLSLLKLMRVYDPGLSHPRENSYHQATGQKVGTGSATIFEFHLMLSNQIRHAVGTSNRSGPSRDVGEVQVPHSNNVSDH